MKRLLREGETMEQESAIKRLYALRNRVGMPGTEGFRARVEFVCLAYRFNVVRDLQSYRLWDQGYTDLGPRTLDACFEMGDSPEVIGRLIQDARTLGYLENIRAELANDAEFQRWCEYDTQAALPL